MVAIGDTSGNKAKWISADFKETAEIDFEHIAPNEKKWANYMLGVIDQFNVMGKK
jgi:hypothetical protein